MSTVQKQQSFFTSTDMRGHDSRRVAVIGDPICGKTGLIEQCLRDSGQCTAEELRDCIEYHAVVQKGSDLSPVSLIIVEPKPDLPGKRRRKAYGAADCVVLCYAVNDLGSLTQIRDMWVPEILMYLPDKPVHLVSLKNDLRDVTVEYEIGFVPRHTGCNLRHRYQFDSYHECSVVGGFQAAAELLKKILSPRSQQV